MKKYSLKVYAIRTPKYYHFKDIDQKNKRIENTHFEINVVDHLNNIYLFKNKTVIMILNYLGYFFVYTLFYVSLYLIFKSVKYLKKYIDYIID